MLRNGSFDEFNADGSLAGWRASGHDGIEQSIITDQGPLGRKALRLTCTRFVSGHPDSHAMALEQGWVALKKDQFYKLTWWARGGRVAAATQPAYSAVVDISSTVPWQRQFSKTFAFTPDWRRYEQVFQASEDLPAAVSRFAFYMRGTGVLQVSAVSLAPTDQRQEWLPRLSTLDGNNFLPNSSFECDTAGWGGFAPDIHGVGGNPTNLPAVPGQVDSTTAFHGKNSLRIQLDQKAPIVLQTKSGREQAQCPAAANLGWIPLAAGQQYVLSCYAKANRDDTPVRMAIYQPGDEVPSQLACRSIVVGTQWQRISVPVTSNADTFAWVAIGLDMIKPQSNVGTLWIDAVQFERGDKPTEYAPRAQVESFVASSAPGNVATEPALGLDLTVTAFNNGRAAATIKGRLSITDFLDKEVLTQGVQLILPAQGQGTVRLQGLLNNRQGFFRAAWRSQEQQEVPAQTLRCAIINQYPGADSPFGMNSPYPWPILQQLARKGGLTWMRDWSAAWDTIEPQKGRFDFSAVDAQFDSILREKLNVLPLLPNPSAEWSSAADLERVEKEIARTGRTWARNRLICACEPKDPADLANYVTQTVSHYRKQSRYFEMFNEPLYTEYSMPSRFGYKMGDLEAMLKVAYGAAKAADKDVQVIGGISCPPAHALAREFINTGGLEWCDIMNLHDYPQVADGAEAMEGDLAELQGLMRARNQVRPIWMTELGCYADDDPPFEPNYRIGDGAMQKSQYESEREAAIGLVKYCAVIFGHGGTKIFFHVGAAAPVNAGVRLDNGDGGGIFFEYGGAPRKMYPAMSAMANLLGPDFQFAGAQTQGPIHAFWFRAQGKFVAVAWRNPWDEAAQGRKLNLTLPAGVTALDLMGNKIDSQTIDLTDVPVYFLSSDQADLAGMLRQKPMNGN